MDNEIIVGIDFSTASLTALKLAIDVANRTHSSVLMVWVETIEKDRQEAEESLKGLLKQYTPALEGKKLGYLILQAKKVSIGLVDLLEERLPYLLVMGCNGNSGFDERYAGANTYKTIVDSPVPTLIVRENFNFSKPLERIVLPIDSTKDTRQKVPWTIDFARMFPNTCIHILGLLSYKGKDICSEVKGYVQSVESLLNDKGINYKTDIVESDNSTLTTIDYAKRIDADMIVIMTEQEKTLSNLFFLGPYAQQMVNLSPYPVLTIRPRDIYSIAK